MKKLLSSIIIAVFISISFGTVSYAQENEGIGIGFMVGEPTGLTLKSWTSDENAFAFGLAWSVGRYDAITLQADYLWHNFEVFDDMESGELPFYYGIGARLVLAENDTWIGARVPLGLNYLFEEAPLGLFIEAAPIFNVAPETGFDIDGVLGIRFYL